MKLSFNNYFISYFASIFFHFILLLLFNFILTDFQFNVNKSARTSNILIAQIVSSFNSDTKIIKPIDNVKNNSDKINNKMKSESNNYNDEISTSLNFIENIENADTSLLEQIYHETTLNVKIKYPLGWTYIDQNLNDKLDGVTFWFPNSSNGVLPYVHLEVKEKDYFEPERFKYKTKINKYEVYYNGSEELENQYSLMVYIRTKTKEDYIIKLVVNGEESFKQYQNVFWAMLKSFDFGFEFF
ncbi:MAG: hypothetical protein STSR0008_11970 [Ignavibacterium sp.]